MHSWYAALAVQHTHVDVRLPTQTGKPTHRSQGTDAAFDQRWPGSQEDWQVEEIIVPIGDLAVEDVNVLGDVFGNKNPCDMLLVQVYCDTLYLTQHPKPYTILALKT